MKIFFDGNIFVDQIYGGISRYYVHLINELSKLDGVDSKIIAPFYRNVYLKNFKNIVYGFKLPHELRTGRICKIALKYIAPVISNLNKPDIIHETYYSDKPSIKKGKLRFTTIYDMIHEKYFLKSETIDAKIKTLDRCDHVFCISKNTQKDLCDIYKYPIEKTSVTYLSFKDFSNFVKKKNIFFNQNKPYILYVGNRSYYKNFKKLLEAFSSSKILIKDFDVIAFGGGDFTHEEIKLIRNLHLDKNKIKHKSGDDYLLGQAYANASVYVNTSEYEGFGIPPLEAMSAGCPVVCSNTSSLPEVVGNAAVTFNPNSSEELKFNLERTVLDNKLRNSIIKKGYKQIKKFTWEKCALKTYESYSNVL